MTRRVPVKRRRETPRRVAVLRDPDYLAYLRERFCVVCVREQEHAAYWKRLSQPIPVLSDAAHTEVNGTGSKGADSSCIPLCRKHHRQLHNIGMTDFQLKYEIDLEREAEAHYAMYLTSRQP
jgi:hypothetical protein